MKKEYIFVGGIIVIALMAYFLSPSDQFGGIVKAPSYTTASSTAFRAGTLSSVEVLGTRGGRGYASLCNTSAYRAYINFSGTAITSTTAADVLIPANGCYEITSQNLWTGPVTLIQETASPTDSFLVTEWIGQ